MKILNLSRQQLTDESLVSYSDIQNAEWLDISFNEITEKGVRFLCTLSKLRYVNLIGNPTNDPRIKYGVDGVSGTIVADSIALPPFGVKLEKEFGRIEWLHTIGCPSPKDFIEGRFNYH